MTPNQMMQMISQVKSNPMSILGQYGVPQNISNDPNGVIQHLMNRGVITQNQYNRAIQIAKNMGMK